MIVTTRRIAAGAAAVALLAGASATAPGSAQAQSADRGATTVALSASALKSLKAQGVTVSAVKPAKLRGGKLTLPVARGALAARSSWLEHDGGLTFRRRAGGKVRTVAFTDLRATLGASSAVSASVGERRVSLFTVAKRRPTVDAGAGTAGLAATKVTLTAKAAALVRKGLRLRRVSRALGSVTVDAALRGRTAGGGGAGTGTAPGTAPGTTPGGTGTGTGTTPPPANAKCGSVANQPISGPEPAQLGQPGTPVVRATVQWHVRESFINYLAGGDGAGDGTNATAPAVEGPPSGLNQLAYDFTYAERAGGSSAVAGGPATLRFDGGVNFVYPAHCIDFDAKAPEIALDPSGTSTAIFTMVGRGGTPIPERRYALLTLTNVAPQVTDGGRTYTYSQMQANLAPGADNEVFGGLYQPGEKFGWVTVSYTLP